MRNDREREKIEKEREGEKHGLPTLFVDGRSSEGEAGLCCPAGGGRGTTSRQAPPLLLPAAGGPVRRGGPAVAPGAVLDDEVGTAAGKRTLLNKSQVSLSLVNV